MLQWQTSSRIHDHHTYIENVKENKFYDIQTYTKDCIMDPHHLFILAIFLTEKIF